MGGLYIQTKLVVKSLQLKDMWFKSPELMENSQREAILSQAAECNISYDHHLKPFCKGQVQRYEFMQQKTEK